MKAKVFVTRKLPEVIQHRMQELFHVTLNDRDTPLSQEALKKAVAACDVLVPTVTDTIDKEVIASAGPQMKLIASFGAGVDHLDLEAAKAKNILVTNTPSVLTEDTADVAMALILAVPRRLSEGVKLVRDGKWSGWSPTFLLGRRVWGKKLGIIGLGRVGQAVARRAKGFGMQVHYHNRNRLHLEVEKELGATYWQDLETMLKEIDILSLHCPATPETQYIMSDGRLGLLNPEVYIVNTARGKLIDEAALAVRIAAGRLAGAGLDVYENEPAVHPDLLKLPNVITLPHLSSATIEARMQMGEKVLLNIQTFINGHRPPDRVLI